MTIMMQSWAQTPPHLQFNRYVHQYYRPLTGWLGCVRSFFYLHNETVNILTHALPIFAIAYFCDIMLPWNEINVPVLPRLHIFAITAPWVGSTLYHLFMNHHGGEPAYKALLALDMAGIWIAQNLGTIVPLCATIYCLPKSIQVIIWLAFFIGSTFSLNKALRANCPWQRRYSFIVPFLFRILSIVLRLLGLGGGDFGAVKYLVLQDIAAISGGLIGALNVPERWAPGSFDLLGNSHQMMHVLVLYAAYQIHMAVTLDLVWMSKINVGSISCLSS